MVVAEEAHGNDAPLLFALFAEKQFGHHGVMAVGEDVSLDEDDVPDGALHGVAAAIDLGTDAFDDDARRWILFIQA